WRPGLTEQEGGLRPAVPNQRRDAFGNSLRSQTSRRGNRLLQCAAHLESEIGTSPARPLCSPGRRVVSRSHALDKTPLPLLPSSQSAGPGFSWQVRGRSQRCVYRWPTWLSWKSDFPRPTQGLLRLAPPTVPPRLGGLLETSIRRPGACTSLPRQLHAPGGYIQPSADLLR